MIEVKHTKGPWHTAGEQGVQIRSERDQIAKVWTMRGNEWKANARLIAAAPELLEALQNALNLLEEYEVKLDREFGGASTLEELDACGMLPIEIRQARAAIAKATP